MNILEERANLRKNATMWWICIHGVKKVTLTKKYYPNKKYFMLNAKEITHIYITDMKSTYTEDQLRENESQLKLRKIS